MTKSIRTRVGIFGKKLGMTEYFNQEGAAIPVTVVELSENIITEVRTPDKNGYSSVQLGTTVKKEKHLNKPMIGNLKKKNLPLLSHLQEFTIPSTEVANYKIGEAIDVSKILVLNEKVDVTGKSIGKGFQGMIKLHNKKRGQMSHGSKCRRLPGSIGGHTFPGRVFPGKRMASRMGNENITVKNLIVVDYLKDENIVLIKGAIPGCEGTLITIKPTIKKWNQGR
jgi:large subunit ribosomal protein L3